MTASHLLFSSSEFDNIEIILLILMLTCLITIFLLVFILVFQRQIQTFFEKKRSRKRTKATDKEIIDFINNLAGTLAKLSYDKTGAIIVIENRDNMDRYIRSGKRVNVPFFSEFVLTLFKNHNSPLHDGAMIVRDFMIVSLSSYLPMTKKVVPVKYGARHRAAFGICEYYDCFVFVVSGTNGDITYSHNDELYQLSSKPEGLVEQIQAILKRWSIYKNQVK